MELIKDCKIVQVEDNNESVTFYLLDEPRREIHTVTWNKRAYDPSTKKFVESDDKLQQVEEWCQQYFSVPLSDIDTVLGKTSDVYCYDTFDSLWESDTKVTKDMVGEIIQTKVKSVSVDDDGIHIRFEHESDTYASHMRFTEKVGDTYYLNPQKRNKQFKNFEDKFGIPIEQKDKLVGQKIMVEFKAAYGKYAYAEIKKIKRPKK